MNSRLPPRFTFAITLLVALIAGAMSVLSFAPFHFWPIQIATLALLFFLVLCETSVKRSLLLGHAFGFGWTAAGVHWLYISMHRYGGMPSWMAVLAVGLLALLLGSLTGLGTGGAAWLRQRRSLAATPFLLLALPATWTLAEWVHLWLFTGFPWVVSGYAHNISPLAGFAPVLGVYGLGLLAALSAASLLLLPSRKWPAGLALLIFAAGFGLKSIDWTEAAGQPISVRLLQGNVPQNLKFDGDRVHDTLAMYYDMMRAAPADLIATPETAIPLFFSQLPPDYLDLLSGYAQQSKSVLVLGVPISNGPRAYSNSMVALTPNPANGAKFDGRYDKHHLVPFGEFIPPGFHWFVEMMNIPLGEFSRGAPLQRPFAVRDQWVLPNICYEDLFGEEIAAQLRPPYFDQAGQTRSPQATVLLNASNIAWFGDSIALPQHLQISRMRALETGRPMLRSTNTGVTAVIDPKGEVQAQLPPFTRGVLAAKVQGYRGQTPYIWTGNVPVVALALLMLGAAWLLGRRPRMA